MARNLAKCRKSKQLEFLRPDGKTQITLKYFEDTNGALYPVSIDTIILSTQHAENISNEDLRKQIFEQIVLPTISQFEKNDLINLHQDEDFNEFDFD